MKKHNKYSSGVQVLDVFNHDTFMNICVYSIQYIFNHNHFTICTKQKVDVNVQLSMTSMILYTKIASISTLTFGKPIHPSSKKNQKTHIKITQTVLTRKCCNIGSDVQGNGSPIIKQISKLSPHSMGFRDAICCMRNMLFAKSIETITWLCFYPVFFSTI